MSDWISELAGRLVVGHKRDGRSIYDEQAKRELVLACREPGVSIAKMARDCGVNANQVNSWVRLYERQQAKSMAPSAGVVVEAKAPAFVALDIAAARQEARQEAASSMGVQARLPNGVVVDLRDCDMQQALAMIEALGRLRCSASTKG
jgi:transposase